MPRIELALDTVRAQWYSIDFFSCFEVVRNQVMSRYSTDYRNELFFLWAEVAPKESLFSWFWGFDGVPNLWLRNAWGYGHTGHCRSDCTE
jgi:hypothetical protein